MKHKQYTKVSEFYSEDGTRSAYVMMEVHNENLYKVLFGTDEFESTTQFKFFYDLDKAKEAAEEWALNGTR